MILGRFPPVAVRAPHLTLIDLIEDDSPGSLMTDHSGNLCNLIFPDDMIELENHRVGFAAIYTRVCEKIAINILVGFMTVILFLSLRLFNVVRNVLVIVIFDINPHAASTA